ncbi:DUF624 domain-containing protein [Salmonella enterica]|nr:DUF624 domain-containing protein [Salmonella enterica]
MWCRNLHSTRIRPWAIFYLFPAGVALHITIRHFKKTKEMRRVGIVQLFLNKYSERFVRNNQRALEHSPTDQ